MRFKIQIDVTLTVSKSVRLPDNKYRGKIYINDHGIGFFYFSDYTVNPDETITYYDGNHPVLTLDHHQIV